LDLLAELSLGNYTGSGISGGFSMYLTQNTKLKPLISLCYLRTTGTEFGYDRSADSISTFQTKDANYLIPTIGIRFDDKTNNSLEKNYLSVVLKVGYKISTSIHPGVSLIDGPPFPEKQSKSKNISTIVL